MARVRYSRLLLGSIAVAGLISLTAIGLAIVSFRHAVDRGDERRSKRAGDLVLCHELAQPLERKFAESRPHIIIGDEVFAHEMEDARSEFKSILWELHADAKAGPVRDLVSRVGALEERHHRLIDH